MKLEQMKIKELLDTSHTIAEKLFEGHEYPWEVLGDINGFIESLGASLPENEYMSGPGIFGADISQPNNKIFHTLPD